VKFPKWYVPKEQRSAQDLSFSTIRSMIWDAVQVRFGDNAAVCDDGIYISYIIFHKEDRGKFFRIGYSVIAGEVRLGESEKEVEKQWVEARSAQGETEETADIRVTLDSAKDPGGMVWDVTIIAPGLSKHRPIPWLFPDEVLRAAAAQFEGVDINLYDLPDKGATHVPDNVVNVKPYLVKKKAGWLDTVRHVAGVGITGVIHFLDSYKWLGQNLVQAMKGGGSPYGLSIDCATKARMDEVDGQSVIRVTKFMDADSVDIVTRPAAGGKFNRAIAAQNEEDIIMKKALWDLIMRLGADLLEEKEFEEIEEEELRAIADTMTPAKPVKEPVEEPVKPEGDGPSEVALLRCEMNLTTGLSAADLPERAEKRIRELFKGKVFEDDDLARAIADEKDYLADLEAARKPVAPVLAVGVNAVGIGSIARAQMAIDHAFGLTQEDMLGFSKHKDLRNQPFFSDPILRSKQDLEDFDDVPAFSGLREMYTFFSGDPDVTGAFNRKRVSADLRAVADFSSATFTYLMANTMARRMVRDYRELNLKEDLLISIRKSVKDFKTQEAVNVGYFPNIATVDPESGDYQEIEGVTDEESTYSVLQKGNLITFHRKFIINDDLSIVTRLLTRIGRAIRRTHGEYVWAFFIDNATCSDGTAWFTSGHGNLGANGLGTLASAYGYVLTAYIALGNMTEKDSGKKIGLLDGDAKPVLVYPIDIMANAEAVANDDFYYTSDDLSTKTRNPLQNKIRAEQISVFTDANDWGLLMPPSEVDIVEMGYLNGRQEPEYFVADSPQSEQMFVGDKVRHKFRHEYAGAPIAYPGGYKAVVT
jgi:hypothetical protein